MAISPPSDIVLDVAKAVEPAGIQAARVALVGRAKGAAGTFSLGEATATASATGASGATRAADKPDAADSLKRFEAMVLQTFVESMLPKNTESVYGKGMAGDMWKSMLAEHLANSVAERGGIGIAKTINRDHVIEGEKAKPIGPVSGGPGHAELDTQTSLTTAMVQEMQRKLARSLGRDDAISTTDTKI